MALSDFIIHSQFPLEKIVWTYETTVDSSDPYWNEDWRSLFIPIPDTFNPENLLVDGVWSMDDFRTTYPINTPSKVKGWYEEDYSYYLDVDKVDVSTSMGFLGLFDFPFIYVSPDVRSSSPKVRLWAYLISSDMASKTNARTAEDISYKLVKNTNLAQLNMISENQLIVPAKSESVIHHNLGFRPFCRIWKGNAQNGWAKLSINTSIVSDTPEIEDIITITSDSISIYNNDRYGYGENEKFIVRIYNYAIPQ